jgi:hypothetical protein
MAKQATTQTADERRREYEKEWSQTRFDNVKEGLEEAAKNYEQIAAALRQEATQLVFQDDPDDVRPITWTQRLSWITSGITQRVNNQSVEFIHMASRLAEAETLRTRLAAQPVVQAVIAAAGKGKDA